jgi:hypothetical protein
MGPGQDFITEGGDPASAADIDGDGADEGLQRLAFAPPAVVDAGTAVARCSRQPIRNYQRRALDGFADPEPGAGLSYAADGASFLTAPAVADLGGDGKPDVIIGSDTSNVAAVQHDGAPGSGGRSSRAAGRSSARSRRYRPRQDSRVAATTREGYILVWNTPRACRSDRHALAPSSIRTPETHGDERFEVLLDFRVKRLLEIDAWCRGSRALPAEIRKELQVAHAAR